MLSFVEFEVSSWRAFVGYEVVVSVGRAFIVCRLREWLIYGGFCAVSRIDNFASCGRLIVDGFVLEWEAEEESLLLEVPAMNRGNRLEEVQCLLYFSITVTELELRW